MRAYRRLSKRLSLASLIDFPIDDIVKLMCLFFEHDTLHVITTNHHRWPSYPRISALQPAILRIIGVDLPNSALGVRQFYILLHQPFAAAYGYLDWLDMKAPCNADGVHFESFWLNGDLAFYETLA